MSLLGTSEIVIRSGLSLCLGGNPASNDADFQLNMNIQHVLVGLCWHNSRIESRWR